MCMHKFYENQSFYGQKGKTPPNTVFVQNKHEHEYTYTNTNIDYYWTIAMYMYIVCAYCILQI